MLKTLSDHLEIALLQTFVYAMNEWPLAQRLFLQGHLLLVKYDLLRRGSNAILVSGLGAFVGVILGILIGIVRGIIQ